MSNTEYKFDGLDEWEKRLVQAIESQYPAEFREMVIKLARELQKEVKEKTPVKTGHLKNCLLYTSVNFLAEEGYIHLRDIKSHEDASLADCDYQTLEAKVTGKGIRLLGGGISDNMVDLGD